MRGNVRGGMKLGLGRRVPGACAWDVIGMNVTACMAHNIIVIIVTSSFSS